MVAKPDFDLVVLGEINPDLVLTGDITPVFGQVEKMIEDATLTIGSSACIFACGASRLGLKVAFIGKVGGDEFGNFMRIQLKQRGVDVSGLVVDPRLKTGLSVILSRGSDRAILTYAGSIAELHLEDVDMNLVKRGRHVHVGSYFMLPHLQPHVRQIFAEAHNHGMTTSLDTNYDPTGSWGGWLESALAVTDVFLPNQDELLAISRQTNVDSALAKLAVNDHLVAVKLGASGGAARQGDLQVQAPALEVKVIDSTGAGDSFDAGFLYGWLNKWGLQRSLQMACVCGSLSTRASGGTNAQPTLQEAVHALDTL
jgi:sugar/nucleoside kinase (ribokinase family)